MVLWHSVCKAVVVCFIAGTCHQIGVYGTCSIQPDQNGHVIIDSNSVTGIADQTFRGCESLVSVHITSDSITSIGTYAFKECGSLVSVNMGDSITSIGYQAFEDCGSLVICTIQPDQNGHVIIDSNSDTAIKAFAFISCSSLVSVNITSDSVKALVMLHSDSVPVLSRWTWAIVLQALEILHLMTVTILSRWTSAIVSQVLGIMHLNPATVLSR